MAQALSLYIYMFPGYGLYLCINLETAHHRNTFGIFCNITQNTTPEENRKIMFHISSPIVVISYGKVKDIFWIRIKFHLERAKGRGKRGYGERSPKLGLFSRILIIKQDKKFISQSVCEAHF